jgi:cytochrome c553
MLSHYGDTAAMRRALVAGKLADYQVAAGALARDEWSPGATSDTHGFVERVRAAAVDAQSAPSLVAAATALSALADVCASCHLASGSREFPVAPEEPSEAANPRMLAHAIASDRLWAGLILSSDESWVSGMQLLAQVPALDAPSPEVSAAAARLNELARQGETAELEQRGPIFRDVMLTCSGCHERLGVVPGDGAAAR